LNGVVPNMASDASDQGDADMTPIVTGVVPNHGPCGGGPCGSVAMPTGDAGDASDDAAPNTMGDAVSDAEIVADDATTHCGGVCGVIIRPDQ
jgi:hypothetical protein